MTGDKREGEREGAPRLRPSRTNGRGHSRRVQIDDDDGDDDSNDHGCYHGRGCGDNGCEALEQ